MHAKDLLMRILSIGWNRAIFFFSWLRFMAAR